MGTVLVPHFVCGAGAVLVPQLMYGGAGVLVYEAGGRFSCFSLFLTIFTEMRDVLVALSRI